MRTALYEGEKVLYVAKKHWIMYGVVIPLFVAAWFIKSFELAGLSVLVLAYLYFERKFNIWAVTNRRFIDEWGIISLNSKDIPLDKVNNVLYKQDIWGRIFGYGLVELQSAAERGDVKAKLVTRPKELVYWIQKAQRELTEAQYVECPYCKEKIRSGAVLCRFCGKEQPRPSEQPRAVDTNPESKPTENKEVFPEREIINVRW